MNFAVYLIWKTKNRINDVNIIINPLYSWGRIQIEDNRICIAK